MTRLFIGTILALCCSTGLLAQNPPVQSSQQSEEKEKLTTVTGCLRAGEEPGTFVLTNVKWPKKDKPVGTAGTAAADEAPMTGGTLRLIASTSSAKMSEHVGHTVEVTGVIVDEAAPKPDAASGRTPEPGHQAGAAQPPQSRPAPDSPQTMNVRTMKMVEENCALSDHTGE